ncbi:MAG: alpha-glucuronidase [Bacteroidaceae bacterium]|nr:alpha-glucuronidase [Bacteroidaceae bacterium]
MKQLFILLLCILSAAISKAEDGSRLWLRYDTLGRTTVNGIDCKAAEMLRLFYSGQSVSLRINPSAATSNEGYVISGNNDNVSISAPTEAGLLYGAFALLRGEKGSSEPTFRLRILNHWDNIDGSVERGYAGNSIFWNDELTIDHDLIVRYAMANASIGINGTVLNNVNASPKMLTKEYINKVKEVADILRPWNIRVYISVNFGTPKALGELPTADPMNPKVRRWWQRKVKQIYKRIPDFGGFLVKANSEGQPGPFDYGRTHAEGANMLAEALKPYGGVVMWRSFVYGANHKGEDRVMQAVSEFAGLDGQFLDNVILQSKNGPLDFQPREPYAPIFDKMKNTPQMAELQITQEYLGQGDHLVFLAPMWKEFFSFVEPSQLQGVAGVANIGLDKNWCGHHFAQANWYAFGRLAWNPSLSSWEIAEEWLRQTFGEGSMRSQLLDVMLRSREACVDYMMPLGLHHIFKFDHHMGPEPDGFIASYPLEWCPVYYHKADKEGVGFNRSSTGSNATAQYREPFCTIYDNVNTCPEQYLLWFHHVSWTHRMNSGRTLWEEMQYLYQHGVSEVEDFVSIWNSAKPHIDAQRWQEVSDKLNKQLADAREWQQVCIGYFRQFAEGE